MLASLGTIAVLHWAVLVIPGFNVVLLGQLAAGQSRAVALSAVAGMTTATLVWAALAVAGVGVVFSAHPTLRHAVQVVGGLYLIFLAFKLWRAGAPSAVAPAGLMSHFAAFRVGFLTSVLNPKIALFYGSVFATAFPPSPTGVHIAGAILVVYINSVIWHAGVAMLLSHKQVQAAYIRKLALLTKASAGVVTLFGLRLIFGTVRELRSRGASSAI